MIYAPTLEERMALDPSLCIYREGTGILRREGDVRGADLGGGASLISKLLGEMVLDLDAANAVETTGVALWPDASGNGHDATQPTEANRPTYTASNAAYNDHATVDFTETLGLSIPDHPDLEQVDGFQVWVVGEMGSAGLQFFLEKAARWRLLNGAGATLAFNVRNAANDAYHTANLTQSASLDSPSIFRGIFATGTDTQKVRATGDGEGTNSPADVLSASGGDLYIGNDSSLSNGIVGSITRVLLAKRVFTAAENDAIDSYLTRYGVAA